MTVLVGFLRPILAVWAASCLVMSLASAQDVAWRVSKVSGQVWIEQVQATPVALSNDMAVAPGQTIRTGRSGRLLLTRGGQTILVASNSSLSLPNPGDVARSRVQQQAGSILLEVDKRDVEHFEVQTPFLAAVVKGTRFRVTVSPTGADVEVLEGRVQVSDFRSGDVATITRNQAARVSLSDHRGLRLIGNAPLPAIEPGLTQPAPFAPLAVGADGLLPSAGSGDDRRADEASGRRTISTMGQVAAVVPQLSTDDQRGAAEKPNAGLRLSDLGSSEALRGTTSGEGVRWRNPPDPSMAQKVLAALSTPAAGLGIGGSFFAGIALSLAHSRRRRRDDAQEGVKTTVRKRDLPRREG